MFSKDFENFCLSKHELLLRRVKYKCLSFIEKSPITVLSPITDMSRHRRSEVIPLLICQGIGDLK
jgi:hypothetical protein